MMRVVRKFYFIQAVPNFSQKMNFLCVYPLKLMVEHINQSIDQRIKSVKRNCYFGMNSKCLYLKLVLMRRLIANQRLQNFIRINLSRSLENSKILLHISWKTNKRDSESSLILFSKVKSLFRISNQSNELVSLINYSRMPRFR